MDNNQQEQAEQQRELLRLQSELEKAVAADDFFKQNIGQLWTQVANLEITRLIRDITSDKFDKDHQGYVNANIELRVWRQMQRRMMAAASPAIRSKLAEGIERLNGLR